MFYYKQYHFHSTHTPPQKRLIDVLAYVEMLNAAEKSRYSHTYNNKSEWGKMCRWIRSYGNFGIQFKILFQSQSIKINRHSRLTWVNLFTVVVSAPLFYSHTNTIHSMNFEMLNFGNDQFYIVRFSRLFEWLDRYETFK